MNQADFLKEIVRHLDEAQMPYMVTGSLASGRYGEIRATYDTDIVVDAEWPQVLRFIQSFDDEYYVSEEAASDAFRRRSMFNIIHFRSGNKVDIIFRKDREYSRVAFGRRRREKILGTEAVLCSPEDIILAKLDWSKRGESERQYRDALGVAKAQGASLNLPYLNQWAQDLGLSDLLNRLLQDARLLRP
jgi:predicted nucleotidyltransferase